MRARRSSFCIGFVAVFMCAAMCEPAWGQRIAVIASPSALPVTKSQLAKIYLGRSFARRPVDLPEGNPLKATFYKVVADSDLAQVQASWARVMFTGRGEPPRELPNAEAVKKAVLADVNAIGYVDGAAVDSTVKALLWLP